MDGMITRADLTDAVQSTALLADVTIHMWGAERSDAKAMQEVKANAGAVGNVGRVVKNLLAGADGALKDTRSAFASVRTLHYGLTLPWVSDPHAERQRGARLLPNLLWQEYTDKIAGARKRAYDQRDKFVDEYPDLVERARSNLGSLADADYPSQDEVRAQFKITVDFEPIPSGSDFRGLPDTMLDKLGKALVARQQRMVEGAARAMWTEARERVEHICARMSDADATFKKTTVSNVRDLVTLLPAWNISGDTRANEIAQDIERMLDGVDADAIRKSANLRANVAEQARAVVDKLAQWGL